MKAVPEHQGSTFTRPERTVMPIPVLAISQLVALDCLCGAHLEGEDTDDLADVYREHIALQHPELVLDRATLEALVIANAYEV
jgi:hypothetical protein